MLSAGRATGIEVPVSTLDCGNRRMNADLRDALQIETHPSITFEVARVEVLDGSKDWIRIRTSGRLVIAGKAQSVQIELESRRQNDGQIRTTGSTPLTLSSFGIDPPTAVMGLVKVRNHIVVHFDLVEPVAAAIALRSAAGGVGN